MHNGDFVTESGKWVEIEGLDAVTQRINNRLKLWKREWFLDRSEGVDWIGIFEKPFSMVRLKSEISRVLNDDDSVDSIESIEVIPDFEKRKISIDVSVLVNSEVIKITREILTDE